MKTQRSIHTVDLIKRSVGSSRLGRSIGFAVFCFAIGAVSGCGAPESANDPDLGASGPLSSRVVREEPPVVTVTLPGEPAEIYRASGESAVTGSLTRRLEARFAQLRAVPCLERAAGIYGRTAQADRLPLAFSEFVLHWSGCPDPFAAVVHILTEEDCDDTFFEELEKILETVPATHAGVARVPANDPYAWRWTVFLTERTVEMQAVPTTAAPGSSLALVVRFLQPVDDASVITTRPDGEVISLATGVSGDRMLAAVEMADRPGTQWIEVVASDASGPHVALLFPVEVGRAPPRAWVGTRRQEEGWITDSVAAEAHAYSLLDQDRARFGIPQLIRDDTLAAVARHHSAEMARTGRIAHVSPTTGTVADRLEAAGYRAAFAAENIARSSTIADAQEGLMRSPGHRAAILTPEVTHIGIGVVSTHGSESGTVYFITQVFARPVQGGTNVSRQQWD